MIQRLTRRKFGQIAIAGGTVAGIATLSNLISKTSAQTPAQTPQLVIIGVRPGALTSATINNANVQTLTSSTDVVTTSIDSATSDSETAADVTQELQLQSLNVGTGQVQILNNNQGNQTIQSSDRITGLTTLADGTFLASITPVSTSNQGSNPTRLTALNQSGKTVQIATLEKQEALTSLLVLNDGALIGLVVRKDGTPPVRLVDVNPETGAIIDKNRIDLPNNQRFSHLAQCPGGSIYTTSVGRDGTTSLVQLDLAQKTLTTVAQLRFNNRTWNNGLQSLVCSSAGQLFALGTLWHDYRQYVYTVDPATGNMTQLQPSDAAVITLART